MLINWYGYIFHIFNWHFITSFNPYELLTEIKDFYYLVMLQFIWSSRNNNNNNNNNNMVYTLVSGKKYFQSKVLHIIKIFIYKQ